MTSKSITGIVTWLKGWFYDKDEITSKEQALQTQINNKASTSDLNTTNTNVTNLGTNKADKTNGATQITDNTAYGNIGTAANVTQHAINSAINTKLGQKTVTVEEQATAESGFLKTYIVKQNNTQVGAKINIPKDFLVKSASVKSATIQNQPVDGLTVGAKYIDFVINTKDGTGTDEHIYIKLSDIIDYSYFDSVYALKNHQSTASTYGLGTTSAYGHVKIVNGLTQSSNQNGLVLSAYQGKVLKDMIDDLDDELAEVDASNIDFTVSNSWGEASQVVSNVAEALDYLMGECNYKPYKNQTVKDIELVPKTDDSTGAIRLIYANE